MPEFLNLTQEESGQIFELTEVVANKLELTKYQVVDWRPLIIICSKCCKRLDENNFQIYYKEC